MGFMSLVFFSIIAGLIYSGIIYVTVPYKIIDLKVAFGYLLGGSLAVAGVMGVHELFPWWLSLGHDLTVYLFDWSPIINLFKLQLENFIQVGFLEEFMKLGVFTLYGFVRTEKGDHPVATMFYMMMISMGFALIENYAYAIGAFGSNAGYPYQTLIIRSFTATLGHMIFGLITGFWLALGRIPIGTYSRSWFDVVVNKTPTIRRWIFIVIGLVGATLFHGLYNFNFDTFGGAVMGIIYLQLTVGLLATSWCFKHINDTFRKSKKKKLTVSK